MRYHSIHRYKLSLTDSSEREAMGGGGGESFTRFGMGTQKGGALAWICSLQTQPVQMLPRNSQLFFGRPIGLQCRKLGSTLFGRAPLDSTAETATGNRLFPVNRRSSFRHQRDTRDRIGTSAPRLCSHPLPTAK